MALNTRNPLLLPEIARHVASLCTRQEQCNWAYTCKTLFGASLPIIWESVYNVECILRLIPGIEIINDPNPGEEVNVFQLVVLDERVLTGDWTRYWCYAPFVKRLSLFIPQLLMGKSVSVRGWNFLFPKLKEGPLLPNLHTLETISPFETSPFDRLAWSALFLSPSLRVLDFDNGNHDPWADPAAPNPAYFLLATLSGSLPEQPKKALFGQHEHPSEHTLALVCPTEYQEGYYWFNNTPNLLYLRELGITVFPDPELVCDALCVIGHLPLLERLKLFFQISFKEESKDGSGFNCELPCTPVLFPSLHKLYLQGVPSAGIFRWIWGLKPLVSRVSLARIDTEFSPNPGEFDADIIQPMREGSSGLSSLTFSVPRGSRLGVLETAYELTSRIPLKELDMCGMKRCEVYPANYQTSTFPHLRRLCLSTPLEPRHWQVCIGLAKALPNLEYLSILPLILMLETPDPNNANVEHSALQPIEIEVRSPLSLKSLPREQKEIYIQPLLKCLRAIWPNASFLVG